MQRKIELGSSEFNGAVFLLVFIELARAANRTRRPHGTLGLVPLSVQHLIKIGVNVCTVSICLDIAGECTCANLI